jgi:hypothetical protein
MLPILFENAGIAYLDLVLIHAIYLRGEEKRLWAFTMLEAKPSHERLGLTAATSDQLAAALAAVGAYNTFAVSQAPIVACWTRKVDERRTLAVT